MCGHTWISQNSCLKRAYCPAGESATGSWIALNHLGAGWVEDEPGGAFGLWRSAWEQPEQLKQLQQPPCSTATLCTSLYLFMFFVPHGFWSEIFHQFQIYRTLGLESNSPSPWKTQSMDLHHTVWYFDVIILFYVDLWIISIFALIYSQALHTHIHRHTNVFA